MRFYYVDSCIYLNLWQREVNDSGNFLWKHAKEFFEKADFEESIIYYSGFLLKELMFILTTEEYLLKREFFEDTPIFKKVTLTREEYYNAQNIKKKINLDISLFDIIHLLLAKKTNSALITRDNLLMDLAKSYNVVALKPEEVL